MRRLAVKLSLLVVIPVAMAVAVLPARIIESVRVVSPFRYHLLRADLERDRVRAVALGDSHAGMGFLSPETALQSFAFGGENVREMALKARYLKARLPHLSTVFVQAQPHMFFAHRDWEVRAEYVHALGSGKTGNDRGHALVLDACCRGAIVGVALRSFLRIPVPGPIPDVGPTGYLRYPASVGMAGPSEEAAKREIRSYLGTAPRRSLRETYETMIGELSRDHLEVVLTRYPLSPAYRATIAPAALAEADRYLRDLEHRYGARGCGAWDAFGDPELFFNADHLNEAGARLYWPTLERCVPPAMASAATAASPATAHDEAREGR